MTQEVKSLSVTCPICHEQKDVNIPLTLFDEVQDNYLRIQIPQGAVCPEHSFMIFIDKQFKIRGYQSVDVAFTLVEEPKEKKKEPEPSKFDRLKDFTINDFLLSLGPDISASIFRTILVGKPILFLKMFDLYNRVDKIIAFLRELESEDLVITAEKIEPGETSSKKIRKSNAMVIAPLYKAIVRSPFIDDIDTRFEMNLLKETTEIPDRKSQIVYLRRELIKINKIIEEFVSILENTDRVYEEDIPALTKKKFNYNLEVKNINVLKEVIGFKYGRKLAKKIKNRSLDKIRTDLW
ncbi:MAG: hypothetical protein ACTSWN_12770 [Promethearchaeota archaeon]